VFWLVGGLVFYDCVCGWAVLIVPQITTFLIPLFCKINGLGVTQDEVFAPVVYEQAAFLRPSSVKVAGFNDAISAFCFHVCVVLVDGD
jgi:hypothetical protein